MYVGSKEEVDQTHPLISRVQYDQYILSDHGRIVREMNAEVRQKVWRKH
jgi:hypothetical protein